jgi:hypothetical protein
LPNIYRREPRAPWDSASTWNVLNVKLNNFIDRLPRDLTLSPANIHAHIMSKTSTPFLMMHTVLLLGRMMLHREYVPFIPLRSSKPEGPLDPPLFSPEQYRVPHGFWEYSATELFRSARQLVDLVHTCHEWNVLPQTPIVGFAVYIAAFVGVYAINFPWMDSNGFMCKRSGMNASHEDDSGSNASRHALSIVAFMRRRLKMADGWFRTINRVHRYYVRVKKDFQKNVRVLAGPSAPPGPLSIREGGIGGGLEEFKMIEATLKEFETLEDHDVEMIDVHEPEASKAGSSADAASIGIGVKSEIHHAQERQQDSGPVRYDQWNAINSGPGANQHSEAVSTTNGSYYDISTPGTTSPVASASIYRPSYSGSNQASPMALPAFGQKLPLYPPQQATGSSIQVSVSVQNQMQAPPPPLPPPMTAEETDAWLRSLDTAFTGDDLSAFVEGTDWRTWVMDRSISQPISWLSTIWTGPQG